MCAGSGALSAAAFSAGRNVIAVESDPKKFRAIAARLRGLVEAQPVLEAELEFAVAPSMTDVPSSPEEDVKHEDLASPIPHNLSSQHELDIKGSQTQPELNLPDPTFFPPCPVCKQEVTEGSTLISRCERCGQDTHSSCSSTLQVNGEELRVCKLCNNVSLILSHMGLGVFTAILFDFAQETPM